MRVNESWVFERGNYTDRGIFDLWMCQVPVTCSKHILFCFKITYAVTLLSPLFYKDRPRMRDNCEVCLPLPLLRLVNLPDGVVPDQSCCDLREFDFRNVLTGTGAVACSKLRDTA
jgi:hypothetical protein